MARGIGRLFARKSVEQMHAEHQSGELKKSLGALNLVLLGIGLHHRHGHLRADGQGCRRICWPGHHDLLRHHRRALRLRGAVLSNT